MIAPTTNEAIAWANAAAIVIVLVRQQINAMAGKKRGEENLATTKQVHALVNTQYGLALSRLVDRAQRAYDLSHDPSDLRDLQAAQKDLSQYQENLQVES